MHIGWTRRGLGVLSGLDGDDAGPTSVHGTLMDYDEVMLAGDGELLIQSPYLPYHHKDTRVVTYVLAADEVATRPGWTWMRTAQKAREHCTKKYGQILEERAAGDHLFFRVYKERK